MKESFLSLSLLLFVYMTLTIIASDILMIYNGYDLWSALSLSSRSGQILGCVLNGFLSPRQGMINSFLSLFIGLLLMICFEISLLSQFLIGYGCGT